MKRTVKARKLAAFAAGMLTMTLLVTMAVPAFAAGGQVAYNQVGVRVMRQQQLQAGETYTAPNGQKVPSSITYIDETGGKTNYLSVRQLSELLDADISWNAAANSVDIGVAPAGTGGVDIASSAEGTEFEYPTAPQYGLAIGALEEIDPATVKDLTDGSTIPARTYTKNTRIQYGFDSSFPDMQVTAKHDNGNYLIYTVANNGKTEQYVRVFREVTITTGRRESFPTVTLAPGETLVRVFRIAEDADPMQSTFCFGLISPRDRDNPTDVTVSLEIYR